MSDPFLEIRLNLNNGQTTVTDENHQIIKAEEGQDFKSDEFKKKGQPEILSHILQGGVTQFKSLPNHIIWTTHIQNPEWRCGWVWDYASRSWIWK